MPFFNPYNFVPAPPRNVGDAHLGDAASTGLVGHAAYAPDHWTGRISVLMRAATPLLVPDMANATRDADNHWTVDTRTLPDGTPHIPATSMKGMLRAAYEAVTNSRMAVLGEHATRLAYRMPAKDGLSLVPAVFRGDSFELMLGTTPGLPTHAPNGWTVPGSLSYAAWLPAYTPFERLGLVEGGFPSHGQAVHFWAEKVQHWRWVRPTNTQPGHHVADFQYWEVVQVSAQPEGLAPQRPAPAGNPAPGAGHPRAYHQRLAEPSRRFSGVVCISNRNIDRKHHERIFFSEGEPHIAALDQVQRTDVEQRWRDVVVSYQAAHRPADVWGPTHHRTHPEQWLGKEPGRTGWSPHIYQDGRPRRDNQNPQPDTTVLAPGTLCFVKATPHRGGYAVTAIYPVMIARALFDQPPSALIHQSLLPARTLRELSPADRVFGWVAQSEGRGAYRGQLRMGPIRLIADPARPAIERFQDGGVPLAILGQPKPQQSRFYAASNAMGAALAAGGDRAEGYRTGGGIRGRKVYPHHAGLPDGHWAEPMTDRTQAAPAQEYRRPRKPNHQEQRDDQNRSVRSWVRQGAKFTFDIDIVNLSAVELGALLWLLKLPTGHHHRLGGGKPLGFGSVKLEIAAVHLANGQAEAWDYRNLGPSPAGDGAGTAVPAGALRIDTAEATTTAVDAFKESALRAYPLAGPGGQPLDQRFRAIPFIRAFLNAAQGGHGSPTHYPRTSLVPNPDGLNYARATPS